MDRMIRITYDVYVPSLVRDNDLDKWVRVPIFMGPVVKVDRSGSILKVQAHGKEVLAKEVWPFFTVNKKRNKISAIQDIMKMAGEKYFLTNRTGSRLPNSIGMAYPKTYWGEAKKIAQSINRYMFYNGAGRLVIRGYPETSIWTFQDGNHGSILSDPEIAWNPENVKNVVRVIGKKKKKGRAPIFTANAPKSHPMSAFNLQRGGKYGYKPEVIQSDSYRSDLECERRAKSFLNARLMMSVDVKFDSLVIPHLEPNDVCVLKNGTINTGFRLATFTIPLMPEGVMTVGYSKSQTVYKSRIRQKRKK